MATLSIVGSAGCTPSLLVPTHSFENAGGVRVAGVLTSDGRCFWLQGRSKASLVWPAGYSARDSPPRIFDTLGVQVGANGDTVEMDVNEREDLKPPFCAVGDTTLLVGAVLTINGTDVSRVSPQTPRTEIRPFR